MAPIGSRKLKGMVYWLGKVRLGKFRLGKFRLGKFKLVLLAI